MGRHPNPRLVKMHRSYAVEEVARLLGKHKNTIRNWIKLGLQPIDRRKPTLVHGLELIKFLQQRRKAGRQPCPPDHIYCLKCRAPKRPAAAMADYLPISVISGNLRAICPDCGKFIHRRVALAKLRSIGPGLDISFQQADQRIGESSVPSVNSDFRPKVQTHEDA
jgi:hypothetical protein